MNNKTDIDVQYVSPLKKILMTIGELPSSYLETMSYYEMLVWFTEFLRNQVIPTVNNNAEAVQELQTLYEELRQFVNNYFDNLDVQEEINNKLEEMAESGQLTDIIAQYLGLAGMIAFDTVADMKEAENLVNGSKCRTLGFHSVNDGGGAYYKVRTVTNDDVIDEASIIAVYDNLLVAELIIDGEINVKQFGAYGDNSHDDTLAIKKAIAYAESSNGIVHFNYGNYKISDVLAINESIKIYGEYEKGTITSGLYGSQITQSDSTKGIFLFENSSYYGVEISKLRLNGGIFGIKTSDVATAFSEFIFEKIHFNGGFTTCIDLKGSIGRISDCDFSSNTGGLILTNCVSVNVNNNNFWENSSYDIKFVLTTDCHIYNNWLEKTSSTGCSLLFQSPSNNYGTTFNDNEIRCQSCDQAVLIDGNTNPTEVLRMINVQFNHCSFSSKIGFKILQHDNSNGSSSHTNVRISNCIFRNLTSGGSAINTDYQWIYWTLENNLAYSSWTSGNVDMTNSQANMASTLSFKNGIQTDGVIKFNSLHNQNFMTNDSIYLSSTLGLSYRENGTSYKIMLIASGSSTNRPASPTVGQMYYDITLNKPIWYKGSSVWVDATGTSV